MLLGWFNKVICWYNGCICFCPLYFFFLFFGLVLFGFPLKD